MASVIASVHQWDMHTGYVQIRPEKDGLEHVRATEKPIWPNVNAECPVRPYFLSGISSRYVAASSVRELRDAPAHETTSKVLRAPCSASPSTGGFLLTHALLSFLRFERTALLLWNHMDIPLCCITQSKLPTNRSADEMSKHLKRLAVPWQPRMT